MEKEINNMNLNISNPVCMDNDLIMGKQNMGLNEAKLLRLAIMQVVREDRDLKTYCVSVTDLANILGIARDNIYRDIRNMCRELMMQVVVIGDHTKPKKAWKMFQWVSCAEYDGNGNIIISLHDKLKPYLIGLSKWYTSYSCESILAMKSVYAIRIFEMIRAKMMFNGLPPKNGMIIELTVDEIRKGCNCENKHKVFKDFRVYVLDIAMREINEKTGYKISYIKKDGKSDYVKSGKKVIGIRFTIKSRYSDVKLPAKQQERMDSFLDRKSEQKLKGQVSIYDIPNVVPAWKEGAK